jgi:transcriptional regulator with XRE-family HTH domain
MRQKGLGMSPTRLANHFNLSYWGQSITVTAADNWINGKSLPKMDKMIVLAEILNTTLDGLLMSEGHSPGVGSDMRPS